LDKIMDEKDRFLFDVQSRPDEADLDAYNRMPLDEYGIAMLRGMGWTEGMPIGKNAQHVVPVIQFIRQPPRVGLGAGVKIQEVKRPEGWIRKPGEPKQPPPPVALPKDMDGRVRHWKTIDEKLKSVKEPFSPGSRLFISGGVHRGLTARTHMKQEEKVVVILPSDERVVVNVKDLQELDENDPIPSLPQDIPKSDSSSKHLPDSYLQKSDSKQKSDSSIKKSESSKHLPDSYLQKSDSKPKSESSKSKKHKSSRKHKSSSKNKSSKDKSSSKDKHKKNRDSKSKKHKKRKRSSSTSSSSESSGPTTTQPPQPTEPRWIATDIRVKICSKSISEGRYYCKHAWIIDILPENRCVLRLEDSGTLLDNIKQADLETVVPTSGTVKVVRGEYCGELGTVYEKIEARNEVYVQLEDSLEICLMSYDDVAQVRS